MSQNVWENEGSQGQLGSPAPFVAHPQFWAVVGAVLGLASCSRPAGQGPTLLPNGPQNCPVCVAMTARKGRGGGPPGHPSGAQEKLPKNTGFRLLGVTKAAGEPNDHGHVNINDHNHIKIVVLRCQSY